ncbi:hypothetical protein [Pseudobythopirellula maris]|uniref:hypothetical protein n=1 Tax=Pseudobythopirellula maris TaxID=2527991 RepID=UPI0011B745DA|nr:hypothetical protein [Pseudobythopirellula maris]
MAASLACGSAAQAQLRIVTYNTLQGPRPELETVLRAIGEESVGGVAKPIDVLLLQEQTDPDESTQDIVDMLNSHYGAGVYARGDWAGAPSNSSIRQGLVYNTLTVELIAEQGLGAPTTNRNPRQPIRYQLRPVGYDETADFYAYNSHYKAGTEGASSSGTTVGARRLFEAQLIRAHADNLGADAHQIYAGDFNMRSSNEDAFQHLLSAGPAQAHDPINQLGTWHNNSSYAEWHTQSPCEFSCSGGFASGGIDDRFDLQLITATLQDDEGLSYIAGSYHTFGNNGSTYNDAINVGNTIDLAARGVTSYTTSQVLNALEDASDHLPVVADYQLPAIMTAQYATGHAPRVIRGAFGGAGQSVAVSVENTAPVVAAVGADELDYTVSKTGDLSGSTDHTAFALAGPTLHDATLTSSATGSYSATFGVSSASQGVQNGEFSQVIDWDVLDPANASFSASMDLDELTIDFGQRALGEAAEVGFDIFNLVASPGLTAGLDLDLIGMGTGDTGVFSTGLETFANLAAGLSDGATATLSTAAAGQFAASYLLTLSDEDLPGATQQTLTLSLVGEVLAGVAGDYNGNGVVDAADFTVWRDTLGSQSDLRADGNGDLIVDEDDYDLWVSNFGQTAGSPSAVTAPEPAAWLLAAAAVVAGGLRRRRHAG